jgi:nucleotide-binding universal stress UspA family protein
MATAARGRGGARAIAGRDGAAPPRDASVSEGAGAGARGRRAMAWKEILVRVAEEPDWRPAAETAAGLAARFGAHLAGLAVLQAPERGEDAVIRRGFGEDLLDRRRRDLEEEARRLGDEFRRRCGRPGLAVEWRVGDGDLVKVVAANARSADLLVLGPSSTAESAALDERHLVAPVVLAAGRPVLFVPRAAAAVGRHAAVAWNGSREAARAVADALPLLAAAERVSILMVRPEPGARGAPPGADVLHHLGRHGVRVEPVRIDDEGEVGALLLARCAAAGVDVLVMGSYGHSRLRELVLGGATRTVLHETTLPVLLSH